MKKTAVLILNYNNAHDTLNCVKSILQHNSAAIKIVIVDNASRPDELDALKRGLTDTLGEWHEYSSAESMRTLPYATLIETGDNLGYARGNNAGLRAIEDDDEVDNVLVLNSDVLFVDDIIPGLLRLQEQTPDCGIISPVLYKRDLDGYDYNCARLNETVGQMIATNMLSYVRLLRGKSTADIYPERYLLKGCGKSSGTIEIELPSGSCMLISKELFRQIGYFDPNTFLYYEENILYRKTRQAGRRNYLSLDHKCIHLGATTIKQHSHNQWLIDRALESRRYYVERYSGAGALTRWAYRLSERFYRGTIWASQALKKLKIR